MVVCCDAQVWRQLIKSRLFESGLQSWEAWTARMSSQLTGKKCHYVEHVQTLQNWWLKQKINRNQDNKKTYVIIKGRDEYFTSSLTQAFLNVVHLYLEFSSVFFTFFFHAFHTCFFPLIILLFHFLNHWINILSFVHSPFSFILSVEKTHSLFLSFASIKSVFFPSLFSYLLLFFFSFTYTFLVFL